VDCIAYTHKNKSEIWTENGFGAPVFFSGQLRQAIKNWLEDVFVHFYRFFLSSRRFYWLHFLQKKLLFNLYDFFGQHRVPCCQVVFFVYPAHPVSAKSGWNAVSVQLNSISSLRKKTRSIPSEKLVLKHVYFTNESSDICFDHVFFSYACPGGPKKQATRGPLRPLSGPGCKLLLVIV
jgi:hypothetical protein